MSDSKNVYFHIVTTQIVSAPNKTEALSAAQRKRNSNGTVLATEMSAERISAVEARSFTAS